MCLRPQQVRKRRICSVMQTPTQTGVLTTHLSSRVECDAVCVHKHPLPEGVRRSGNVAPYILNPLSRRVSSATRPGRLSPTKAIPCYRRSEFCAEKPGNNGTKLQILKALEDRRRRFTFVWRLGLPVTSLMQGSDTPSEQTPPLV